MPDSERIPAVPSTETQTSRRDKPTTELSLQGRPEQEPKLPRRRVRQRKRVKLSEAMRACGIDERAIADKYVQLAEKLNGSGPEPGDKLLADMLKEWTRVFDPRRAGENNQRARDEFVSVQLIHSVPRPVRGGTSPKAKI